MTTIHQALRDVGIPPRRIYARKAGARVHDWPEGRLYDLLDDARRAFRRRVRGAHPDLGGDHAACSHLLTNWRFIQRWMRARGIGV